MTLAIVSYIPASLRKEIRLLETSLAVNSIRKACDEFVVWQSMR